MNYRNKLAIAAVALLGAAAVTLAAEKAMGGRNDVIMPTDSLKWADGPVKGVRIANVWGDMNKGGPYGVMVKFDGGLMHELHSHSQDLRLVVISGTFVHQPEGGKETKLGAGSYLLQAGGKKHVSGCAAGSECVFYMTSKDKFDMTMAEGEKK